MKIALLTVVFCLLAAISSSSQTIIANYVFYFSAKSAEPSDSVVNQVELIAQKLQDDTTLTVRVVGHTSMTEMDNLAANQKLSEDRAKICMMHLRVNGVKGQRIFPSALGPRQPVAADDTEENRAKNRRVEIRIIKM